MACGFKEIEVAFPSASETEFKFVRHLIENQLIPHDVTIQVMTQAKEDLIDKTFQALKGVERAIVHVYNATVESFRRIVFKKTPEEVIQIATNATHMVMKQCQKFPETKWTYQYSPETFCFTEERFALDICEAVAHLWQPNKKRPLILNLPTTVETHTPNIFADQIESFCAQYSWRAHTCISIHPHNDRGTGVATAELALMAGAQRIEGCLFGNGERTGNVDLVNIALNLYTQGVSPCLDFSNIQQIAEVVKSCNELPIHPRHPYVGDLVFTAFSGSHQDAIKKGFAQQQTSTHWEVPYLPIDPADLGCNYNAIIRVNSQSGKSGTAWILQQNHDVILPQSLQYHFSQVIQKQSEDCATELTASQIWQVFCRTYGLEQSHLTLKNYQVDEKNKALFEMIHYDKTFKLHGKGNGLLSCAIEALNQHFHQNACILEYVEHSLGKNSHSRSISYVLC